MTPIDIATNTAGTPIPVGSGPDAIAITPDGKTAYVVDGGAISNTNFNGSVTPIDTATNTAGPAIQVGLGPDAIAITPDQPPVARFSETPPAAGQASSFDASASTDPDGTIASYHWDFGDGSSQTTASATTTHTYTTPGTYTVTLMVTDNAGCSTTFVFTGQTASCNGSPVARSSQTVIVSPATPTSSAPSSSRRRRRSAASIADQATVSGGDSPTGTVTFNLYNNPNGSGTPLFTDAESRSSSGMATSQRLHGRPPPGPTTGSRPTTATATTTRHQRHRRGAGDDLAGHARRSTRRQQPASATVGGSIADQATVSGGDSPTGDGHVQPVQQPERHGDAVVHRHRAALAAAWRPQRATRRRPTGTDYWVATYNGDANNNSVSAAAPPRSR